MINQFFINFTINTAILRFERVLDPTLLIPAGIEGEQESTSHSNKLLPMTLSELSVEKFDQYN